MNKLKLTKTKWSSVVGGGFEIVTDKDKRYSAMIIGDTDGMDKDTDEKICAIIIDAVNKQALLDNLEHVEGLEEALKAFEPLISTGGVSVEPIRKAAQNWLKIQGFTSIIMLIGGRNY